MAAKKMAIIATKGALDMAYPPLILSSTAAAMGWEVQVFFTFYGLQLLRKDLDSIKISPLANPAMPMPVPMPVIVSSARSLMSPAATTSRSGSPIPSDPCTSTRTGRRTWFSGTATAGHNRWWSTRPPTTVSAT